MKVYGGIDLHSNNNYVVLLDEGDRVVYRQRLGNDLEQVLRELGPYQAELVGVVVESTYNGYWLVDGLLEAGYRVHLANPAAIQQYEGLKYSDDCSDAVWLARMLRLGVLPEGYIYPKQQRGVRDLLRHRSWLVRQHTSHLLQVGNILARNRGKGASGNQIRSLSREEVERLLPQQEPAQAVESSLAVMRVLEEKILMLEKQIKQQVGSEPSFRRLEGV